MTAMKYRNLRITWSIAWGIACVLLAILWVRSYSSMQIWNISAGHAVSTADGTIMIDGAWEKTNREAPVRSWSEYPNLGPRTALHL